MFLIEMSLKIKAKNSTSFFSVLTDFCDRFFNVYIYKYKARIGIAVRGVRLLSPKEESNFEFKYHHDPVELIDPWAYRDHALEFIQTTESISSLIHEEYNKLRNGKPVSERSEISDNLLKTEDMESNQPLAQPITPLDRVEAIDTTMRVEPQIVDSKELPMTVPIVTEIVKSAKKHSNLSVKEPEVSLTEKEILGDVIAESQRK